MAAKKNDDFNQEKSALIDEAISKIEKNYGKGSIMKLGDKRVEQIDVIPTQCLALDVALGVGGFPKSSAVCVFLYPPSP